MLSNLRILLDGYAPQLDILLCGFSFGFHGAEQSFEARNLRSALQNPAAVDAKLQKELGAGRLAGPFISPPFKNFRFSPLGLVPKKQPGKFHMIHHLSFPKGSTSVNDGIPDIETSVRYATVDDAIQLIKQAVPGCFLAKTDIKNAFRIILINLVDYHPLGIKWRKLYIKIVLCPWAARARVGLLKPLAQRSNGLLGKSCLSTNYLIYLTISLLYPLLMMYVKRT